MGVWPPEAGLQGQASNHLMLLRLRDVVVSDEEKAEVKLSGECREDERKRTVDEASKWVQTLSKGVVASSTLISSGETCLRPERQPVYRRHELCTGFIMERGNLGPGYLLLLGDRGGATRSSDEAPVMGVERRGCVIQSREEESTGMTGRNFTVNGQTIPDHQTDGLGSISGNQRQRQGSGSGSTKPGGLSRRTWQDNLYRLWNRMASGSYFPPAVRRVEIPKGNGGKRPLGIPTITGSDCSDGCQTKYLEPLVDPYFDPDSYGYRPGKSAHDAVGQARRRCWNRDWVLDLDIKAFFDSIDHELDDESPVKSIPMRSGCCCMCSGGLKRRCNYQTVSLEERLVGTPQGGVISPLLANLFLHYAFDRWMRRQSARYSV